MAEPFRSSPPPEQFGGCRDTIALSMSAFGILFPILGALIAIIGVVVAVANLAAGPELGTRLIALLYLIAVGGVTFWFVRRRRMP